MKLILLALSWASLILTNPHALREPKLQSIAAMALNTAERAEIRSLLTTPIPGGLPIPRAGQLYAGMVRSSLAPGQRDLLVKAGGSWWCGASGNCSFWILRERSNGFEVLLRAGAQRFAVADTSSHHLRDIVTYEHGSATYGELRLYQFDGARYRMTKCHPNRGKAGLMVPF